MFRWLRQTNRPTERTTGIQRTRAGGIYKYLLHELSANGVFDAFCTLDGRATGARTLFDGSYQYLRELGASEALAVLYYILGMLLAMLHSPLLEWLPLI